MARNKSKAAQATGVNFNAEAVKKDANDRDPWVRVSSPSDAAITRVLKAADLKELNNLSDLGRAADKVTQYAPFVAEVYQKAANAQIAQDDLHTKIVETDSRQLLSQLRNRLKRMTATAKATLGQIEIGVEAENIGHALSEDHRDKLQILGTQRSVGDALRSQKTGQSLADLNNQVKAVRVQVDIAQEQHEIETAKNFVDPRIAAVPSFIRPGYQVAPAQPQGSKTGNPIKDTALAIGKTFKLW